MMMAQSYAKNLGLYGERVGALSVVSEHTKSAGSLVCTGIPKPATVVGNRA